MRAVALNLLQDDVGGDAAFGAQLPASAPVHLDPQQAHPGLNLGAVNRA
jgi:hypothetical protein